MFMAGQVGSYIQFLVLVLVLVISSFTNVFQKQPATCTRCPSSWLTECGAQVEGPVVACACPGGVVLEAHLGRALQKEMADGFRDATPVAVSGSVSAPEVELVVEAAVSESESVDGDFCPPVGVTELPSQADGRLQGSVVGAGVGGGAPKVRGEVGARPGGGGGGAVGGGPPPRLPLPEEEVAVDGSGLAVLQ